MPTILTTTRAAGARCVSSYLMLVVLALFGSGITTTVAGASFGNDTQSEAEEIEESVVVSSPRRRESGRLLEKVAIPIEKYTHWRVFVRSSKTQRAIVGHRHANGLLAPMLR